MKAETKIEGLPTLDDLFGLDSKNGKVKQVIKIPISDLEDFPNQPFKVRKNDEFYETVESIKQNGVIHPIIVRQLENGKYQIISGHKRKEASIVAGKQDISAIVEDLTDDEAKILVVDSNIQREKVLPSERAFAYKMKLEALKHQGKKIDLYTDETSHQVGGKSKENESAAIIGRENGDSISQVRRYIRLTYLIPELLQMVDDEKIKLNPAANISFLNEEFQSILLNAIKLNDATPSTAQAMDMKERFKEGTLTADKIDEIMSTEKANQIPKIKINEEKFEPYFPRNCISINQREDFLLECVKEHYRNLQRKREREQSR